MTRPILYSFRRCPYAMRARMALIASGEVCALREVVLRDKPAEMLAASPKGTVPVLVLDDGAVIDESLDVMLWALRRNDPDAWLAPAQGDLPSMLALIADNDGPFKAALDRYKYATRYDGVDPVEQRQAGLAWLDALAQRLTNQAHLFGDRPALADVAIFPFVRQFANTDPSWWTAAAPETLQNWLSHWVDSPLFAQAMPKHAAWSPGQTEPLFP